MADREPIGWFTMNGKRVPIFEGESKGDAVNRAVANANADTKARQIAENKRQSENARSQSEKLPRRLYLDDIKAEEANKSSDVLNLRTKQRFKFKNGTNITEVHVFAGKGCSKEFRDANKYAKKYGGRAEDWQHCSGKGTITNGKVELKREIHWVQGADGKMHEAFIKEYPKKLEKRK